MKSLFIYICFMQLSNYISDLLYRYECVIIPNFGGFVSKTVSSKVNHFTHTFYPPTKQLSFNSQLKNNDGLLANYISAAENCSFEIANEKISALVNTWENQLKNGELSLNKIGTFSLNKEQNIVFEPIQSVNYLTSSFGLESCNSPAIKREAYKQKAAVLTPVSEKKSSHFFKYAAAIAVMLTVGTIGWNTTQQNSATETEYQNKVTKKIQEATFVISNPFPEINLDVVKVAPKPEEEEILVKKESTEVVATKTIAPLKNYHIIAGAFGEAANALKKVKQLNAKGFDAKIVGVNKWGLTQVAFESFETRSEAVQKLKVIKAEFDATAWLFIKK